jgi:hypothetical protein
VAVAVAVGDPVIVAVGVGLQLPPPVSLVSTDVIVCTPSYPPTATATFPISVLEGNERSVFRLGPIVQLSVTGS